MSRLTREDFAEMRRCNERPGVPLSVKEQEQMELERQKEAFFAKGGKIHGVQPGATGIGEPREWGASDEKIDELKGTVGITDAAAYCGMSKKSLDSHISRKQGPIFKLICGKRRFVQSDLHAWLEQRRSVA